MSKTDHWNKDIRDPVIFDPTLTVARFVRADSPTTTIATVVNWADHPEMSAFGANNLLVSAHYVHYLRDKLEQGVGAPWLDPIAGIGGITVFVQGALGGLMFWALGLPAPLLWWVAAPMRNSTSQPATKARRNSWWC